MKDMVFQEKAKLWVLKTVEWQSKSRYGRRGLNDSDGGHAASSGSSE